MFDDTVPTGEPTELLAGSSIPTIVPTGEPSGSPTATVKVPTGEPSGSPTATVNVPTGEPSGSPTATAKVPTGEPSGSPTATANVPSSVPSSVPSACIDTLSHSTAIFDTSSLRSLSSGAFEGKGSGDIKGKKPKPKPKPNKPPHHHGHLTTASPSFVTDAPSLPPACAEFSDVLGDGTLDAVPITTNAKVNHFLHAYEGAAVVVLAVVAVACVVALVVTLRGGSPPEHELLPTESEIRLPPL